MYLYSGGENRGTIDEDEETKVREGGEGSVHGEESVGCHPHRSGGRRQAPADGALAEACGGYCATGTPCTRSGLGQAPILARALSRADPRDKL